MSIQATSPIAWPAELHGASELAAPHQLAQDWPLQTRSTASKSIVSDDQLHQRVLRAISRQGLLSYDERDEAPARPPPPDRLQFHPAAAAAATLDGLAASYEPQDDRQQMSQQQLQRQAYDNYHRQVFGWPNKNLKPVHVSISQATVNGLLSLLLLFVIAIYGSIGSIFLMSALTVMESLQTRGNCYLASLAMSHLTVTLFVIPSSALQIMAGSGLASGSGSGPGQSGYSSAGSQAAAINVHQLCHYQWLVLEFSFLVSQLSFMLIAADNYLGHLCSERVVASVANIKRQDHNHDQVQTADSKAVANCFAQTTTTTTASQLKPLAGGAKPSATAKPRAASPVASPAAGQSEHQAALSLQAEFLAQSTRHKLASTTSFDSNPIRALLSCRFGGCCSSVSRSGSCCLSSLWRLVARAARGLFSMWRLGARTSTSNHWTRRAAMLDHHQQHFVPRANPPLAGETPIRYNNSSSSSNNNNNTKTLDHEHEHSSKGRLARQFARETNSRVERPNGCFNYRFCCGRLKVVMWICVAWALALVYVIHKHELSFGARFCAAGPAPATSQSHGGTTSMKAAHAKQQQQLAPTQHLARPPPDRAIDQRPVVLNSLGGAYGESMRDISRGPAIESHRQQVGIDRARPTSQRELTAAAFVDAGQRSRRRRRDAAAKQSSRVANQLAGWLSIGSGELDSGKLSPPESSPARSNPIMMDFDSLTGSQLDASYSGGSKPPARAAQAEATKVAPAQQAGPTPLRPRATAISRARLGRPGGTRLKLSNAIARIIRLPVARTASKSNQNQNKVEVEHEAAPASSQVDRAEVANLNSAKLPFTASESKRGGASNNDGEQLDYAECQERHGSDGDKNVSLNASPSEGRPFPSPSPPLPPPPPPPPATTTRPIIMDDGRRPGERSISSGNVTATTTWEFRGSRFGAGGHDNKDEPLAPSPASTSSDSGAEGDEQAAEASPWFPPRLLPSIGSAAFDSSNDVDGSDQGRRPGPLDTGPSSSLVAPRQALDESSVSPTDRHIDGLASSWPRSRAAPAAASIQDAAAASVGQLPAAAATDNELERERTKTVEIVRLLRRSGRALEESELEAHWKGSFGGWRDSAPSPSWLGMTKLEKQTSGDGRLKGATRSKTTTSSQGQLLLVDGVTGSTSRDSPWRRSRQAKLIAGVPQTTKRIATHKGWPPEPLDEQARDANEIEDDKKVERPPGEHERTRGTSTSHSSDHYDESSARPQFIGHECDSCHRNKLQTNGSSGWEPPTSEPRARESLSAAYEVGARRDLDLEWPTNELDDKLGRDPAYLHRGLFALGRRSIEDKRPPAATRIGHSDPVRSSGARDSLRTVDLTQSPGELPTSKSITSRQPVGLEGAPWATSGSLSSRAEGVELSLGELQLVQQRPPPLMNNNNNNNNNTNNWLDGGIDAPLRPGASLGSSQRVVGLHVADRLMPTAGQLAHFDMDPIEEAQQQLDKVRLLAKRWPTLDVDLNAAAVQQRQQALPRTIRVQVENLQQQQQQPSSSQQRQQRNNKTHSSWPLFASAVLLPSLISGLLFARAYVQMKEFKTRPYRPMPAATLASTPPTLLTPRSPIPLIVQRQVYAFDGDGGNGKARPAPSSYESGCCAPAGSVASSSFSTAVLPTNNNSQSCSSSASSSSSSSSSDCHCQTETYDDQDQDREDREDREEEDAGESLARAAQATVRRVSEIANDLQASSSSRSSSFRRNTSTSDNKSQPKPQKQQQQPHAHRVQLNQVMSAPLMTCSGRASPAYDYHQTGPIIDRYVDGTLRDSGLSAANLLPLPLSSMHFNPSSTGPELMQQQHHQQLVMNQTATAAQMNHQLQHQQLTGTQLTNNPNGARPVEWLSYKNLHHHQQQQQRRRPQRQPGVSYSAPPSAALLSNSGRGESIQLQQQATTSRPFLTNYLVEDGDFESARRSPLETSNGQPLQVRNSEPRAKCQRHSSPITYQSQWPSTASGSATVLQPADEPQTQIAHQFRRHQHHAQSFHYGSNSSAHFQDHRQQRQRQQRHSMKRRTMNAHFSPQAAPQPGSDLDYQDFAARHLESASKTKRQSSQSSEAAKSRALANVIRSVDEDIALVAGSSSAAAVAPNDAGVPPSPSPTPQQQRIPPEPAKSAANSAGSRRRGATPKPLEMSAIRSLPSESPELAANSKTTNSKKQHNNETNSSKVILCTYPYMTDDQLLKSNMIVFVVHSTFWLPFVVLLLMIEWGGAEGGDELAPSSTAPTSSIWAADYRDLVWWLATLNCCTCPYLYALSNKDFREAFNKLFYYCCCKSHVTFARKTPIFRRQLDVDSEGNLRVHIIPGLNSYSNKLFNGSGGCSMGLGGDLGVLGSVYHEQAASSVQPPQRQHHAASPMRAGAGRPYSARALAGQRRPGGRNESGPSQQQLQARAQGASNSASNNDNDRHIRSGGAAGQLGVGPLAPAQPQPPAAASTAAMMMIDSGRVTRVGSFRGPGAAGGTGGLECGGS